MTLWRTSHSNQSTYSPEPPHLLNSHTQSQPRTNPLTVTSTLRTHSTLFRIHLYTCTYTCWHPHSQTYTPKKATNPCVCKEVRSLLPVVPKLSWVIFVRFWEDWGQGAVLGLLKNVSAASACHCPVSATWSMSYSCPTCRASLKLLTFVWGKNWSPYFTKWKLRLKGGNSHHKVTEWGKKGQDSPD